MTVLMIIKAKEIVHHLQTALNVTFKRNFTASSEYNVNDVLQQFLCGERSAGTYVKRF